MNRLWELLPDGVRAEVDEELAAGSGIRPIQLVHANHGIDDLDELPSLDECRETVRLRRAHLQEAGLLPPASAVDLPAVLARARLLAAPVVAVETEWVCGAAGPYPRIVAVVRRGGGELQAVHLASLPDRAPADVHELGAGLSAELGVPLRNT